MDLKFAFRSLRKNPGFTLLAVVVMALGIGANTAVFSVVNSVLLKPLAYRDPDRIVTLSSVFGKNPGGRGQVSAPDFHDWHDQATAFDAMAYYSGGETSAIIGPKAEYARVAVATPEFFRVFQVEPVIGRLFSHEEEKPGTGAVVLSHSFWQSRFGGNANVLGQSVRLVGKALTIVGVLSPGFHFPGKTDIWLPANTAFAESTSRGGHNFLVIGRLKPNVSLEQARAQMTAIGARLAQQYPGSNKGKSVAVTRLQDQMVSNIRLTLYLLLGAVGLVLLIACANVANLLLARSTGRTREIAIRAAVGASRSRIIRQLITESFILAMAGGALGLLLAMWGSQALVALAPQNVPRLAETGVDGTMLAFTLGISILASMLFGLAPALAASRVDLNNALKASASSAVAGGSAGWARQALVVAEIALSVVLLTGAGLLIKSFAALHDVELGYRPERLLVMTANVPTTGLEGAQRATRFYKDLLAQVKTLPSISAVGATRILPGNPTSDGSYWIDHAPDPELPMANTPNAVFSVVAPDTFATLGIPIKQGRDFHDGDTYDAPFTAIINEALARQAFPKQNPIGHVIYCGLDAIDRPMKIVGVAGDIRQYGPAQEPQPEIFMPYEQHPRPSTGLSIVVRTHSDPGGMSDALRRKVQALTSEVPVKFTTMEASLYENMAAPRFRTLLLSLFAGLAVCLAMAGIYGVMAYMVTQRINEIGIRMALGANSGSVLWLVLRQSLILAGVGLVLGLAGAVAATRFLESLLFEVKPTDPLTYAGVAALLGMVVLAASYFPARRAATVDPLVALRQE